MTELRDPALVPLSAQGSSGQETVDDAASRFSLAVAQALQSDQREIDQACKSRSSAAAARTARFDWQANCFYRRH